ncbi:MAG: radical SAM protein [Planctomycetota bacterium]
MKILLVKAPSTMHVVQIPIGLGYLSSYLRSKLKDVEIEILDCLLKRYNHHQFSAYVREKRPDIVGVTAFSMEIESALRCCEIVKDYNKNIITVVGGPHATNEQGEVLSNRCVDFIFRSEAEVAFYEFIKEIENGRNFHKVPNLGYKENGKPLFNPIKAIENLDDLPMPDYELMHFERYPKTYIMKYYPSGCVITSRGCPFPCTYCSARQMSGDKFRSISSRNIIEEIRYLKERYHIKEFQIWDDNFTLNKKRVHDFCELLEKEKINLKWWCPNGLRLETLDAELIRRMKQTGLYSIAIGIESGSEKIQRDMKKNLNLEKIREVITLGNQYGIRMQGFFIIGYPTETREDILKTIQLAKELPLKRASFLLFQPLAGSEIYKQLKEQGKLQGIDLSKTEYSKPSLVPEGLSGMKELIHLHRKAILEFYLRPRILFRFMLENLSIDQLKELWVMIRKYLLKI